MGRAKAFQTLEKARLKNPTDPELLARVREICAPCGGQSEMEDLFAGLRPLENIGLGTTIFAVKPGDGSAREQAASCQKVLGGWANLAVEYATKRYRSNLINWGMLPFVADADLAKDLRVGDYLVIPNIRKAVEEAHPAILACLVHENGEGGQRKVRAEQIGLSLKELTDDERRIILDGCLINFYNSKRPL